MYVYVCTSCGVIDDVGGWCPADMRFIICTRFKTNSPFDAPTAKKTVQKTKKGRFHGRRAREISERISFADRLRRNDKQLRRCRMSPCDVRGYNNSRSRSGSSSGRQSHNTPNARYVGPRALIRLFRSTANVLFRKHLTSSYCVHCSGCVRTVRKSNSQSQILELNTKTEYRTEENEIRTDFFVITRKHLIFKY